MGRILHSLGFAAALAAPLAAEPSATVAEQVTVDLVEVDVHVTGRDGRPVTGLGRDEFRLFEDGRPLAISHFAWVPEVAPAGERTAAGRDARSPRQIALFFDELQSGERNREPLVQALHAELVAALAPDDLVSVVRFDGARLDVLLDASDDRGELARAVGELAGYSAGQLRAAQELREILGSLRISIEDDPQTCSLTGLHVRNYSNAVRRQVQVSAEGLLRYAERLARQPGRALLVHLSGGIPMIAGNDALEWAAERCDGAALARGIQGPKPLVVDAGGVNESRGYWTPRESRLGLAEFSNARLWRDVTARINTLGVTLYPVLFGESESRFRQEMRGGSMTESAAAIARQNSRQTLELLAAATGGLFVDAVRDTAGQLGRLLADFGGYYSLGFSPAPDARPGVREIRVEVGREDVAVRHRESYRLQTREESVLMQLAGLFDAERVDDPLQLAVELRADEASGGQRLRVVVPFDRISLVDSPDGVPEGRFTLFVSLRGAGGRPLATRQRSIVARRLDPAAPTFTCDIALPDRLGREVAVAVVDDYTGAVGFARQQAAR